MDVEDENLNGGVPIRRSLQQASDVVKDSTPVPKKQKCSLSETITLAKKLQNNGIENVGSPFVSLECMTDFFVRNKKLEPLLANLDSSASVDPSNMKEYLWHNFTRRATTGHFTPVCKTPKGSSGKQKQAAIFDTPCDDAWTKIEDLPIFAKESTASADQNAPQSEEEMETEEICHSQLDSQTVEDEKISIAEFLDECQESKSGAFTPEFLARLNIQSESNLLALLASCSNSDLYIPLLLNSASQLIRLIGPLCEKILLPLARRDGFDGTAVGKTCTLIIAHPLLMSTHLLVPLVKEDSSCKSLAIKLTNLCENEEIKHTFVSCLLNSDWTAKKSDLELLQCLLGSTVPKNTVIVQLVCQMFKNADADIKGSSDFAKLLLQTIKSLKSDLTEECRHLLRLVVAEIKSPLRVLMEKQLQ